MKICGIYKIENKINHKIYIGQSIDIKTRWTAHKRCSKYNDKKDYRLYQAINKYGLDNFDFSIIEECKPQLLNEREIYYIQQYDSYNNGYNMTYGGSGLNGITRNRNYAPKNISQFCGTNDVVEVAKLDKKFNILAYYPSVQEAARQNNVEATNISKTLQGKNKYCGNYIYMYGDVARDLQDNVKDLVLYRLLVDLYPYHCDYDTPKHCGKIQICDLQDNILDVCNTITEASKKYNVDSSSITKVCKGKIKQSKGYKFKYL